jgi:serine/threonine protein kinase
MSTPAHAFIADSFLQLPSLLSLPALFCPPILLQHFAEIVGTPFYMAPEVLERCYGPAADVWSVGVVIYLMIAGCLPFNGNTDRQIIKAVMDSEPDFTGDVWQGVSQAAQEFIQLMLVKDPRKRASIEQLLAHPWMAGRTGSSSKQASGSKQASSSSSSSASAGAATGAAVTAATSTAAQGSSSSSSTSCPSSSPATANSSSKYKQQLPGCSSRSQPQDKGLMQQAPTAGEAAGVLVSPRLAVATGSKAGMR